MRRGFIAVGASGRLVHYRRHGEGPALVLLHGSPNSSISLTALIETLAPRFDCVAPDTPGNGESDPLGQDTPSTADYAAALKETVDAMGLKRFGLYGFHTGAGTAAEFMALWPERVASAVLDGLAAWTPDEQNAMLQGYLPAFAPRWDGGHLAWLWARVSEQTMFFPWHRPSRETRLDYDLHGPQGLHDVVMQFLAAGDNYRKPYAAALAGDGAARARRIAAPTLVTAHPRDPIAHHLDRLSALPACVQLKRETREDRTEIWSGFGQFLAARPGDKAPNFPRHGSRGFVATRSGAMHWRGPQRGDGRPLLLLHGAGASSREFADGLDGIGRPTVALDLPGHGDSDGAAATIEDHCDAVADALRLLDIDKPAAIGAELGGAVAIELKRRGLAHEAAPIGAPIYSEGEARDFVTPDLSVRWDGAHLIAAWRYLRLKALYDPWFLNDRAHINWDEPLLDDALLHRRCVDLLKSGPRHAPALRAMLAYPLAARMREAGLKTVFAQPGDALSGARRLDRLRASVRDINVIALPRAEAARAGYFTKVAP